MDNNVLFEHIVNLLANGLADICGIEILDYKEEDYDFAYKDLLDKGKKDDDICREEIWTQILFNKKPLILIDEEGESHNLYLSNIKEQRVNWKWLEENGDFYDNNAILQKAIFGEVVYG